MCGPRMQKHRVLIVEDEQDIAGLIKHSLERSGGAEAEIVGSGDAALKDVPRVAGVRNPLGARGSRSSHEGEGDEAKQIELRQAHVSPFP